MSIFPSDRLAQMAARRVDFSLHPENYRALRRAPTSLTDDRYIDLMEEAAGFKKAEGKVVEDFQKKDFSLWTRVKLFFSSCKEALKVRWKAGQFFLSEQQHSTIAVKETLRYEDVEFYAKLPVLSSKEMNELFADAVNGYFTHRQDPTHFRNLQCLLELSDLDQDAAVEQLYSNRPQLNLLEKACLIEAATIGGKDRVVQALLQEKADKNLDGLVQTFANRFQERPETWRPHQAIPLFDAIRQSNLSEESKKKKIQQVMNLICEEGRHNTRLGPMFIAIANSGKADLIRALYEAGPPGEGGIRICRERVENREEVTFPIDVKHCCIALLAACKRSDVKVVRAICDYERKGDMTFAHWVAEPVFREIQYDKKIREDKTIKLLLQRKMKGS